jgi:hypothetical protein
VGIPQEPSRIAEPVCPCMSVARPESYDLIEDGLREFLEDLLGTAG